MITHNILNGIFFQLPHVTHHEVLTEVFRLQNKPKSVIRTVTEAAMVNSKLVTESLLRSLVKVAKQDVEM